MSKSEVMRFVSNGDAVVSQSEWESFFACKFGQEQPYAYLIFTWLDRAQEYSGEQDHLTLPNEEVVRYLVDFAGFSEEGASEVVYSNTNANSFEDGELYFWKARQFIRKAGQ